MEFTPGPVPLIELLVNHGRQESGKAPVPFQLSDIHPNTAAWMKSAELSRNLSFIPEPVDAADPHSIAISTSISADKNKNHDNENHNSTKVFRLFCLSFHHFDDATAAKVLKSTLGTSDAFAIVELQERRVGSLVLMLFEFWLLFLITTPWFWHERLQLALTYVLPVLPAVHCSDGLVSCLRTRTFEETLELVDRVHKGKRLRREASSALDSDAFRMNGWMFRYNRAMHTWPMGYMNIIYGRRVE